MSTWADEDRFFEETEAILRIGVTVWNTRPRTASVEVMDLEKNGLDAHLEDAETAPEDEKPEITRDDLVKAVETFTGRAAYIEHGGGGLEYLYAALDREGNYAWIGWADSHEMSPAMAEDPNGREIVVAGAMYRLSYTDDYPQGIADTYYGLEDEPVTESGLRVAILKWVARAMAANIDPKTEWESV